MVLTRPVPELQLLRLPRYQQQPARALIQFPLQRTAGAAPFAGAAEAPAASAGGTSMMMRREEVEIVGLAAQSAEFRATFAVTSLAAVLDRCEVRFGIRLHHTNGGSGGSGGNGGAGGGDYTDVVYQLTAATAAATTTPNGKGQQQRQRQPGQGQGQGQGQASLSGMSLGMWVLRNHTGGVTSEHGDNQPQGGPVILAPTGTTGGNDYDDAASVGGGDSDEWSELSLTVYSKSKSSAQSSLQLASDPLLSATTHA